MITDQQVRKLRKFYQSSGRLGVAAARAGMSEPTARKFLRSQTLPSEHRLAERGWRTHADAFEEVWPAVEELLKQNPGLQALTIFEHLQRTDPGKYQDGQLRTLQRRIKVWRATAGPAREVFFAQRHTPGHLCESDFTNMSKLGVTIAGQQFDHLLYHFVLPYSNWETGTVCFSESFESLSDGFQNALWELGGVPNGHRTDQLSTAVHKMDHPEEFTQRYRGLLNHYGVEGRKIQVRRPNENGDVEQSHYRFKDALDQALMLRGSRDFCDREAYAKLIRDLFKQRNAGRRDRLAEELAVLSFLPARRLETRQKIHVRVGPGSTIRVAKNTYSVHSRLKGETVVAILGAEDLEIWYGQRKVDQFPRLRGEGKHRIEYRHVIDSLSRKPGALEDYRYREDLFPSSNFRVAYDNLVGACPGQAAKEYLGILKLAAREGEARVEMILRQRSAAGLLTCAKELERLLSEETVVAPAWDVCITAMNLGTYDELLSEEATRCLATPR